MGNANLPTHVEFWLNIIGVIPKQVTKHAPIVWPKAKPKLDGVSRPIAKPGEF